MVIIKMKKIRNRFFLSALLIRKKIILFFIIARIKYTIARYYTPSGRSIQAKGIEPDITVLAGEMIQQENKEEIEFDKLVKEKNLVNHLEPEKKKEDKAKNDDKSKNGHGLLDLERLKKDIQINRALDILISYGVFNKLNGKEEETN